MAIKNLITPALPYANGAAHLGHLVEQIQVNIFARAMRMTGEDVLYVCGADTHGTPIELSAKKAGVEPGAYAAKTGAAFEAAFRNFFVEFDGGFGSTDTPSNQEHANRFYNALKKGGHTHEKTIEQLFDPEAQRFLPDRMVRGTCPKCDTEDQYGDHCEHCNSTYNPTDLKNPKSALSGATPVLKESEHVFVALSGFTDALKEWTSKETAVPAGVRNYLEKWFEEGLADWDITRDGPYFGFPIPNRENQFFYVWLDAPIGYVSITDKAARERGQTFEDYWKDEDARIWHFIGKDIIYFHTLFWPAMLMAAGYTLPRRVQVHGMLTVDGVKMSKSRGTFLNADDFYEKLGPIGAEALRYYYACKLNDSLEDIDLNLEDFVNRVNADLVNNAVNLVSRSAQLLGRHFEGKIGPLDDGAADMLGAVREHAGRVEALYRSCNTAQVVREVTALSSIANKYLQDEKPWQQMKSDKDRAHTVLSTALYVGKIALAALKPIVPAIAEKAEALFNVADGGFTFQNLQDPMPEGTTLGTFTHLFERLQLKAVQALVVPGATPESAPNKAAGKKNKKKKQEEGQPAVDDGMISIDDFMRVDLRAAKVLSATDVDGADKLICVRLDVGSLGERQVFAGLKPHVMPAQLEGKMVAVVANLKPRKMRFGMSEGMILAAGDTPSPVFAEGASPGDRIR